MVRSAALCVFGISIGLKHSNPSGINSAWITVFYTNLNSADAESRWTHYYTTSLFYATNTVYSNINTFEIWSYLINLILTH